MKRSFQAAFFASLVVLLLLGVSAAAATAPASSYATLAKPHRLVLSNDLIQAFAQDGNTVAWINSRSDQYRVRARNLASGKSVILGAANNYRATLRPPTLAIAGTRVLWTTCWFGTRLYVVGRTTTVAEQSKRHRPKPVFLFELGQGSESGSDGYFAGATGDGSTLVYGWTHLSAVGQPPAFDRVVDGGGVVRVQGPFTTQFPPPATPIPNLPGPAPTYTTEGQQKLAGQLAVSQGRIAVMPPSASVSGQYWWGFPRPAENGPVAISTRGGTLISRAVPVGIVGGIALAWPNLAVLVQRHDGTKAVELYDANTAALESATVVPAGASDLTIGTGGLVYRVARSIYTIRAGRPALVWRVQVTPIGLSIEGRRVAWAANIKGRGRIVALTLSR
jgi:hypothetical protein